VLGAAMSWQAGAAGTSWGELALTGTGEAWRTRLIVVRIDPRRVQLSLDTAFAVGQAAWTLDRAHSATVVAVNAGQFVRTLPWGWVMLDGMQFLRPSIAPLVSTVTIGVDGAVRMTHASLPDSAGVRWAFQSYPTLVSAGVVPEPLRVADCGVNVAHRDARLALGLDRDGRVLIAMTRFDAMGGVLDRVPFGVTTPEMAAVMGALGAIDAVLLDGGISAQLMVRDATGEAHRWPGMRQVPLALVGVAR
jgi:exopolysaccharide biosynthesis protein